MPINEFMMPMTVPNKPMYGVIDAVAVVVDRATGAKETIEAAGYPYYAAIALADLGLDPQ